MKKKGVLFVDQGLAFGGSFIVAARLASHLSEEYRSVIITSAALSDVEHHVAPNVGLIFLRKILTYKHRAIFQDKLNTKITASSAGKILRKLLIYSYSVVESILNVPYSIGIIFNIYKNKIDIVHGNNAFEAITCARFLKRKVIWHIHGDGNYAESEIRHYLQHVDKFIAISKFSAGNAIAAGLPAEKIVTIYNPTGSVHLSESEHSQQGLNVRDTLPANAIVIGIFGRLVAWKGQLEFLKAAKKVIEQGYCVKFLIVGDDGENFGSYTNALTTFVAENNLQGSVIFTGYVKNTDEYYQLCNIVVHASIMPEPFGLVIIEAMKNGAAVIAANTGAAPELVIHKVSGLVVDPNNTSELAEAMIFLIDNLSERLSYINYAKKVVETDMNPDAYAKQVELLYSKC